MQSTSRANHLTLSRQNDWIERSLVLFFFVCSFSFSLSPFSLCAFVVSQLRRWRSAFALQQQIHCCHWQTWPHCTSSPRNTQGDNLCTVNILLDFAFGFCVLCCAPCGHSLGYQSTCLETQWLYKLTHILAAKLINISTSSEIRINFLIIIFSTRSPLIRFVRSEYCTMFVLSCQASAVNWWWR